MPDMVFWVRRDGVFLDYFATEQHPLVLPPDRIVGARIQDAMPPAVASSILAAIEAALASRTVQIVDYQLRIGGRPNDFEARILASGDDQAICVVRDVTERTRMQAQLAIADRLSALGTLAAGVAHEINNPLTYILIGVESVAKELKRRAVELPYADRSNILVGRLEGALEGARRVRRIVADLKAFARDEEDDGPVDVRAVLERVTSLVDNQIRYRGRLVKEYVEVPMVAASADRLHQVFLNLLINAAHALPEGKAADNLVRIVVEPAGDEAVAISISDSGHGIAADDLGRIFDPFYTTKPVGIGTGLGLWICHSIVTHFGGQLSVESQIGVGTTFRVQLPAAPAPAVARDLLDGLAAEDAVAWRSGRILIVDDEAQVSSALGLLFEGCEVVTCSSGREALSELERDGVFDWIFCDLMMPDVSGMDVHREVRRASRATADRMVFMTGGAFTPRAREFLERIDNPVLNKPFRGREVASLLRERTTTLRARASAAPPEGDETEVAADEALCDQ
jgi:two-component system cell cycle sensor histidine kinase/response regulator CckA